MHMTLGLGRMDTPQKIDLYCANGAKEFFAGYIPKSWINKYGWEVCPNRRPMSSIFNFNDTAQLRTVADAIHANGATLDFTLNAHDNGSQRLEDMHDLVSQVEQDVKPDSYIVADPSILVCLEKWGVDRPMHISTGMGCFNSRSIRFFCERFNVKRIVIPRKMTLTEMRKLIESLADLNLEFEVMIIGYRCYFNDEDCHSIHSGRSKTICSQVVYSEHTVKNRYPANWKDAIEFANGKYLEEICYKDNPVDTFCKQYFGHKPPCYPDYLINSTNSGSISAELMACLLQTCGLCAIKELRDMGVQVLKVPIRGESMDKLRIVKMVNDVMSAPNPDQAFCRNIINCPDFCDAGTYCYYDVKGGNK